MATQTALGTSGGGTSQSYCLRWNNHKANLIAILDILIQKECYVDCTIHVDGNQQFKAHRVVLAANSPYFQSVLQDVPMDHCSILMPGVKPSEMRALIEYMYTGEVNVAEEHIPQIIRIAEQLEVKGLYDVSDQPDHQRYPNLRPTAAPEPMLLDVSPQSGRSRFGRQRRLNGDHPAPAQSQPEPHQPFNPHTFNLHNHQGAGGLTVSPSEPHHNHVPSQFQGYRHPYINMIPHINPQLNVSANSSDEHHSHHQQRHESVDRNRSFSPVAGPSGMAAAAAAHTSPNSGVPAPFVWPGQHGSMSIIPTVPLTAASAAGRSQSPDNAQSVAATAAAAAALHLSSVYEDGSDMNPLKRKKLSSISSMLMTRDTPILRNVLAQSSAADSSEAGPSGSGNINNNHAASGGATSASGAGSSGNSSGGNGAAGSSAAMDSASSGIGSGESGASVSDASSANAGESTSPSASSSDSPPLATVTSPAAGQNGGADGGDRSNGSTPSNSGQEYPERKYKDMPQSPFTDKSFDDDGCPNGFDPAFPRHNKPEWKRYKQYTRTDIMSAIECVRNGMSALKASRQFGVPSRTLYDKVKKMGIATGRPPPPKKNGKRSSQSPPSAAFPFGLSGTGGGAAVSAFGGVAGPVSQLAGGAHLHGHHHMHSGFGGAAPDAEHEAAGAAGPSSVFMSPSSMLHHHHQQTANPSAAAAALLDPRFLQQALEASAAGSSDGREALHAMAFAAAAHAAASSGRSPSPGSFLLSYMRQPTTSAAAAAAAMAGPSSGHHHQQQLQHHQQLQQQHHHMQQQQQQQQHHHLQQQHHHQQQQRRHDDDSSSDEEDLEEQRRRYRDGGARVSARDAAHHDDDDEEECAEMRDRRDEAADADDDSADEMRDQDDGGVEDLSMARPSTSSRSAHQQQQPSVIVPMRSRSPLAVPVKSEVEDDD